MILKKIFWFFWKIWFYALNLTLILLLSPLLLLFTAQAKWYRYFYWVARNLWAKPQLYAMGFFPKIKKEQSLEKGKSYMLVANHASVFDIMLLFLCSKNPFVFVGKKELAKIPIFGYFYKRIAILVDRQSPESRKNVYVAVNQRLTQHLSICIFPEGGVPDDESIILDNFKDGAFRIAIEHQIPIVPITLFDTKKRFPFRFFAGSMGQMRVKINPFFITEGLTLSDKNELKEKVKCLIFNQLADNIKSD